MKTCRTLVVTGASRGIGAAVAQLAGSRGYSVAVNFRSDEAAARAVVNEIRSSGGSSVAIHGDVAVEADIIQLFQEAEQKLGPIYGLVNNAGVTGGFSRVETLKAANLAQVLNANIAGTILCSREAVKRMSHHRGGQGGVIVNISSLAASLWPHEPVGLESGFITRRAKAPSILSRLAWHGRLPPRGFG